MNPKGDDRHFPLGSSSTAEERPATLQGARKLSRRPGRPYRTAPSKGARSRMIGELMSPDTPKSGGVIGDRRINAIAEDFSRFRTGPVPGRHEGINLSLYRLEIVERVAGWRLRPGRRTGGRMLPKSAELFCGA